MPTHHALLIGSETYGLAGCNADVALMADVLGRRGFDDVEVRTGKDAKRAGIIDGLERLVSSVTADSAVVVYYSGHGGRIVRPDFAERKAAGLSVNFQFIVPFDLAESETDDFRGITSEELTLYQRRLTEAFRTLGAVPNVTTILDCCHSGYMARNIESRQKSVDVEHDVFGRGAKSFRMLGIREHLQKLGREAELGGIVTNPDAVRLIACQPEESAFELPSSRGGRHGALTDALATVLDGLGSAPISWAIVGDLVRRRVRALQPEQRPDVEGPAERMPFSPESAPASDALAVTTIRGVATVEAGELLGLAVGDELDIVSVGSGQSVGTATVKELVEGAAVLKLTGRAATAVADGSAIAVPRCVSVPKLLIHVGDIGSRSAALRKDVTASTRLGVTEDLAEAIAGVGRGVSDGSLALLDATGGRWRTADFTDDAAGRRDLVDALHAIAVGHRLLDLASGRDASCARPRGGHRLRTRRRGRRRRCPGPHPGGATRRAPAAPGIGCTSPCATRATSRCSRGCSTSVCRGVRACCRRRRAAGMRWARPVPRTTPSSCGDRTARCCSGRATCPPTPTHPSVPRRSWCSSPIAVQTCRASARRRAPPAALPAPALEALVAEARTGTREVPPAGAGGDPLRYRLETVEFFLSPS